MTSPPIPRKLRSLLQPRPQHHRCWGPPPERVLPPLPEVFRKEKLARVLWTDDPDLQAKLFTALSAGGGIRSILQATVNALTHRLRPSLVRACLLAAGIHPASVALATTDLRMQEPLCGLLAAEGEDWEVIGKDLHFTGPELPQGLEVPGQLLLRQCPGDLQLPEDLSADTVVFRSCRELKRIPHLPARVRGLRVEHAPLLETLPQEIDLPGDFYLSACPRLERLPASIQAPRVTVTHCPGIRIIQSRICCSELNLESLINLAELDLDLHAKCGVDLTLPSLRCLRGRLHTRGRLRIAAPGLQSIAADIKVGGDLVVEGCRELAAMEGALHVKLNLFIRRNPRLTVVPDGQVTGISEFADLPALKAVGAGLVTSRRVRFDRCASLEDLPGGTYRGSLELLDLPGLTRWPAEMDVGILTELDCPNLPDLGPGVVVRTALRRARTQEREALAAEIAREDTHPPEGLQKQRQMVQALAITGVPLERRLELLVESGVPMELALIACVAEGMGRQDFLERCLNQAIGQRDLVGAARTCLRATIHPASMALLVKDRATARWLAQLLSPSRDLALGLSGDGNLRVSADAVWDLPEDLVVPGSVRYDGPMDSIRWPAGLRTGQGCSVLVAEFLSDAKAV